VERVFALAGLDSGGVNYKTPGALVARDMSGNYN
jgi:hypothetical protein